MSTHYLEHLLVKIGWIWRLTVEDVQVYLDIYMYGGIMGRVGREWESQSCERLLSVGWIRQANSVAWVDIWTVHGVTKMYKSNTPVYKAMGLSVIVEMYKVEMLNYLESVNGFMEELVNMANVMDDKEGNCRVKGKNDVYTWVKQCEKLVSDVGKKNVVVEKYVP